MIKLLLDEEQQRIAHEQDEQDEALDPIDDLLTMPMGQYFKKLEESGKLA